MTFEEKKLEEIQANAYKELCESDANLGTDDNNQWLFDGDKLVKTLDIIISQALKEQREEIDENWKYKIQQVIKKISGSEYEEKQVWRDFIKLIQEI